jgi:diguanylate cyclase (GGDEF)-like protein
MAAVLGCGGAFRPVDTAEPSLFASFRDIPGVTAKEIAAIETIKMEYDYFAYGMPAGIEAFANDEGEVQGFTALFCEWLSGLFGIAFVPSLHNWSDLLIMIEDGTVDFTGEMRATPERRRTYYMTDTIAERIMKRYHLSDIQPFEEIAKSRPLRYGLIEGSASTVLNYLESGTYTMTYVPYLDEVPEMLRSGQLDAFFHTNNAEINFIEYDDIIAGDFLPIINSPVSLTAKNQKLEPLISIVQKALQSDGVRQYLAELYKAGYANYNRHRLFTRLTTEEKAYIQNNAVVKYSAENNRYPVSFYDAHAGQWQGIAADTLKEVEALTGLSFKIVNDNQTTWPQMLSMLENGQASMISELIPFPDRIGRFYFPDNAVMYDHYALLSKEDYPNLKVNEVLHARVGLLRDRLYVTVFNIWFPFHEFTTEFDSIDEAVAAMDRGEIDLIMGCESRVLYLTNYQERPEFKANIVFDSSFPSVFGFNKNEKTLCAIVDKALGQIDTAGIARHWMSKTYDYKTKMAQARLPWLIGATTLSLVVLALVLVLFFRNRSEEKRMEILVQKRTAEIEQQRKLLEYMSLTDPLTSLPNRRNFDMRLDIEWQIAIREKQRISFLMLDIDHFKRYNDLYGHQQGDEVLCIIARTIENTPKRPGDFVARWGGEEFAVLLSNTGINGALKIAEAIRENIEKTNVFVSGSAAKLTVSIGVNTQSPEQGSSLKSFISVADKELYRAKEDGRNRVCFPRQFYEKLG